MPDFLKAVVLGCVQGATEFLPISSSAHLLALERALDFRFGGLTFDVSVHIATLLAVILYFRWEIAGLFERGRFWPAAARIALATVPVAAAGFLLADFRRGISPWFAVGGWTFSATYLLLTRGRAGRTSYAEMPLPAAFGVGLAQALSIVPGVSRSGSTIAAGLWLGLSRESAAKFSFLIAIPAMLGAGLHEARGLLQGSEAAGGFWALSALAASVAFLVGLVAIHALLAALGRGRFWRFGWYNLAAAAAFATFLLFGG